MATRWLFVDHVSDRAIAADRHHALGRALEVRICQHGSSLNWIPEHAGREPTAYKRGDQIVHESSVRVGRNRDAVPLIGFGRRRLHARKL
jgi:hypothetical protein